jgi:hypothetical protein
MLPLPLLCTTRLATIRSELERTWAAQAQVRAAGNSASHSLRRSSRPSSITGAMMNTHSATTAAYGSVHTTTGGSSEGSSTTTAAAAAAAVGAGSGSSGSGGGGSSSNGTSVGGVSGASGISANSTASTGGAVAADHSAAGPWGLPSNAAAAAATGDGLLPPAAAALAAAPAHTAAAAAAPAPVAAMVAAAVETRRRQSQLSRRLVEMKPDLVLAIRNARAASLTLSLIQAQLVLAEVLLTQGDARGALMMLRAARHVSRRQPPRQAVARGPPLLATLLEVDALWARAIAKRNGRAGTMAARVRNLLPSGLQVRVTYMFK